MTCPYHEGHQKILACLQCKMCVCEICIDEYHSGHNVRSFQYVAGVVTDELMESVRQSYTMLKEHQDKISTICHTESDRDLKSKLELQDKGEKIKRLVDEVTDENITKLREHNDKLLVDLDEAKKTATAQLQKVQQFQDEVARLKTSNDFLDIVEQAWCMKVPEVVQIEFSKVFRLTIKPDMSVNRDIIETMFGELVEQNIGDGTIQSAGTSSYPVLGQTYNPISTPTSSIDTFDLYWDGPDREDSTDMRTDIPAGIKCTSTSQLFRCELELTLKHYFKGEKSAAVMRPTMDGNCWLRYHNDHSIKLVSPQGSTLKVVQYGSFISDIMLFPGIDKVSVTCPDKKLLDVWVKNDTNVARLHINTDQMKPYYTCGAPNREILVLMTNKSSCCEEPNTQTVLVRYDYRGNKLAQADKDGNGDDLFFFPSKICSSNAGLVVVVNRTNMLSSHLMLLDDQLGLLHRYIDHGCTVTAEERTPELKEHFSITDALFNHNSLLIISEYYSRTVQLLDRKCNQLKLMATEDQSPPLSMALHANGDLWIGLHDKTIKVYKHSCTLEPEEA